MEDVGNLLQSGSQEEMSICPRCHESVPRTLYCLNCGYPLYREIKVEIPKAERPEAQVTSSLEPESKTEREETRPPEPPVVKPEETQEEKMEEGEANVVEEFVAEATQDKTFEAVSAALTNELTEENPKTSDIVTAELVEPLKDELVEAPTEVLEEEEKLTMELLEEEPIELEAVKEEDEGAGEGAVEALEVTGEPSKPEIDPMILEVMDNLAHNISLKVKLVELTIKKDINEGTVKKLLENYAAKGELWINKRNEILERSRYEVSTLEKAIENARAGLEELDIRRAIGDASDDEYLAKAPAYEWDINHLNEKLTRKRLEISYLESLSKVMSVDDFESLKEIASSCHHDIDELAAKGRLTPETVAEIKSILEEALELLKD
ncbi:MAG: hypothetical protein QXD04_02065 [Candidatus Bathyarchaeia archaeon]